MAFHSVDLTITQPGQPAVAGAPTGYVPEILILQGQLLALLDRDSIRAWPVAGAYKTAAGTPITDIDPVGRRTWTAANALLTRESNGAVMGGHKRWSTSAQAAEGLRGALDIAPSNWAGYTIIIPDIELNTLALNQCLFSIGTSSTSRMTLFASSANGRITFHNGTGGSSLSFAGRDLAAGTRYSVMVTYDDADGAAAIYVNEATPLGTGTIDQSPPNSTARRHPRQRRRRGRQQRQGLADHRL